MSDTNVVSSVSVTRSLRSREGTIILLTRLLWRIVLHLIVAAGAVLFIFPLVWMLSTSVKTHDQVYLWPPQWIPSPIALENYPNSWSSLDFATFYKNTIIVTGSTIVGTVLSSALVAFGFARVRFVGRDLLFLVVLATMMLPNQVTMIPIYVFFSQLGWINTLLPLIVPSFFGTAFHIFLLRQFFMTIPQELDEAAKIDGCSLAGIFWRIMLPLTKPALGVVAIFTFTFHWNEFFGPLLYLQTRENFTIALGLRLFQDQTNTDFPHLMAMSTLALVPQIVIFFFAQRYFVQGIVMTGIKG